jgi:hypothetical protein
VSPFFLKEFAAWVSNFKEATNWVLKVERPSNWVSDFEISRPRPRGGGCGARGGGDRSTGSTRAQDGRGCERECGRGRRRWRKGVSAQGVFERKLPWVFVSHNDRMWVLQRWRLDGGRLALHTPIPRVQYKYHIYKDDIYVIYPAYGITIPYQS